MRRTRRPSVALIIAVMALIVAVGGQSIASATSGGGAQTAAKKKHKKHKKSKKGKKGPKGDRGPQGATGPTGPTGAAGASPVYAHVNVAGTAVDHAKGITAANLVKGQSGIYCLKGLPAVNNVQVTLDSSGNLGDIAHATLSPDPGECGSGAQAEIDINHSNTGGDHAFFVLVN